MTSARLKVAWRADVQGLRAVAVALVVADHAGLTGFAGGFLGVDVFFVVSGFLITTLLVREARRTGGISLRDFYARRARRILPAATVVLVVTVLAVATLQSLHRTETATVDALWAAFFLANVHFAHEGTDYFAADLASPFQHFWSLAVEEQFYLVWPLLLVFMVHRGVRRSVMLWVTGLLTVSSLAWSIHLTQTMPAAAYFSSPARAFELGCGAFLALWGPRFPHGARVLLGITGATVLGWACVTMDATTPFPGAQALFPVLATVALLASAKGPVAKLLALRPLGRLGDISYSLYLWHWPVLLIGAEQVPEEWAAWQEATALVAVSVLLSVVTYLLVERPFQERRVPVFRGSWSLALWPATLGVVAVASLGAAAHAESLLQRDREIAYDWYERHPTAQQPVDVFRPEKAVTEAVALAREGAPIPPTIDLAELGKQAWRTDYSCLASFEDTTVPDCAYGDTTATRTLVVHGDSHAGMWLPALDVLGQREHFKVVPLVKSSCAPFDVPQTLGGKAFPSCPAFRVWARDRIAALKPDALVLGYRGLYQVRAPDGTTEEQTWSAGVTRAVRSFAPLAGQVLVVADVPLRPVPAPDCLSTPGADQATCLAPATGSGVTSNPITRAALQGTTARFVDPTALFCSAGVCPLVVGDHVLYYDDDHINSEWAKEIAPRFGELLAPVFGSDPQPAP